MIASFFGYIFGGVSDDKPPSKIAVAVVDQDNSDVSRKVVAALRADAALDVKGRALGEARELVRGGKTTVAVVLPPGFADRAGKAFSRGGDKPEIQLLYDPSHNAEVQMVRGVLMQHVMEVVSRETMSGSGSARVMADALREMDQSQGMKPADQAALRRVLEGVGEWNQRQSANPQARASGGLSMPYTVSQACSSSYSWGSMPAWWCCTSGAAGYGSGCKRRRSRATRLSAAGRQVPGLSPWRSC